jgi:broad specificity phosphatase PhoE
MNLYLIRHGDSAVPEGHIQKDFPLSELGKRQATAVAERMAQISIHFLFSSPLIRTRETAEIIGKSSSTPVKIEKDFREMDLGHMAGMSRHEIFERYGDRLRSRPYPRMEYEYVNGESPERFHGRVTAALEEEIWMPLHGSDSNVVVVAHGGVICAILLHFLGLVFDGYLTFLVDCTGVSKIDARHGRPRVRYVNDTSHLKALNPI